MSVAFENQAAERIYNAVLSRTAPQAKQKAKDLFSLAAKGDDDPELSEQEAGEVEDKLKASDCSQPPRPKLQSYGECEVNKAREEFEAWQECRKIAFEPDLNKQARAYESFIRSYPKSRKIPRALSSLASIYRFLAREEDAIATYEKLVRLFPSAFETPWARQELFNIYRVRGEDEKAFHYSKEWISHPPEPKRSKHHIDSDPAEKSEILLFQADYFWKMGKSDQAKAIFRQVVALGRPLHSRIARGALYELEGRQDFLPYQEIYWRNRAFLLEERGKHALYAKRDLAEAKRVFNEHWEIAKKYNLKNIIKEGQIGLKQIGLVKAQTGAEAIKAVAELKQEKKTLNYMQMWGPLPRENIFEVPVELYLLFLMLNSASDVQEVRMASAITQQRVDFETKTPRNYYFVLFRNEKGWAAVNSEGSLKYEAPDIEGLTSIFKRAALQLHTINPKGRFASTLKEFYFDRSSPYDLIRNLEEQKLSAEGKRMIASLPTQFLGAQSYRDRLMAFVKAFSLLPGNHFHGLRGVNFGWKGEEGSRAVGAYDPRSKLINLADPNSSTPIHEIVHHWDFSIAVGSNGKDFNPGDPSFIYYKISWQKIAYASCGRERKPCGGWERRQGFQWADFANEYGMSDGLEDLATSAESYIEGKGGLTRQKVREQMARGRFEPAAKHLFHKYVRSLDPKDGLCFEYNITPTDPPLSLIEVKVKLAEWLRVHPRSVAPETLDAIKAIEKYYLEFKVSPGIRG